MIQPLHIALEKEIYKNSKVAILSSEIAILNSLKRLATIRQTQLQQQELRKRIFDAFDFLKEKMTRLAGRKLPEIGEIPKLGFKKATIQAEKQQKGKKINEKTKTNHKRDSIGEELMNIQRKLDILNNC